MVGIAWNAVDIKVRLVIVPLWVGLMLADAVLVQMNGALTDVDNVLVPLRTIFYVFQSAILINNLTVHRFNIINVWQSTPNFIGNPAAILSFLLYVSAFATNIIILATLKLKQDATVSLVAIKIITGFNLLMMVMGAQLYCVTIYHVLVNGDRAYEMMPIELVTPVEEK